MKQLSVDLGERSYPILIAQGLLSQSGCLSSYAQGEQVMIVTNTTVAPLYLASAIEAFAGKTVATLVLPDGEQYKNLDILQTIYDALIDGKFDRGVTLAALGGGVIGDMTGFAAATYQRGVDFIQIPTTLLAQVDSSVGGKTAVNHPRGKNMIGAFHQPRCVLIDIATLLTLPEREFQAGLAEVIKYGLIADAEFFNWLEHNAQALLARNESALMYAIEKSCQLKAKVVSQDERERGARALLNFGHTFGHAIETAQGYQDWLHGEAVAAGMVMAAQLSVRQGWLSQQDADRARNLLVAVGLPVTRPASITPEQMLAIMSVDKKVLEGTIRLVLLKAIGDAVVSADYSKEALQATLNTASQGD